MGEAILNPPPIEEGKRQANDHCAVSLDRPRRAQQQEIQGEHDGRHGVESQVWEERQFMTRRHYQLSVDGAEAPVEDAHENLERRRAYRENILYGKETGVQRQVRDQAYNEGGLRESQPDDGQELEFSTERRRERARK